MLLHAFRQGIQTTEFGQEIEFSVEEVAAIAAAYDPALFVARIFREHRDEDEGSPPLGEVSSVYFNRAGLFVVPDRLDWGFEEELLIGARHSISVRLWRPEESGNPTPGQWALRHVAFPRFPGVLGLSAANLPSQFSDGDNGQGSGESPVICTKELMTTTTTVPGEGTAAPPQFGLGAESRLADLERQLAAATAQLQAQRVEGIAQFAGGLVTAGKLKPAKKDKLVEILLVAPSEPVQFSGGGESKSFLTELQDFLAEVLPVDPRFGRAAEPEVEAVEVAQFAAPAGAQVDRASAAIHSKVLAYQRANGGSFTAAVIAVKRGGQ